MNTTRRTIATSKHTTTTIISALFCFFLASSPSSAYDYGDTVPTITDCVAKEPGIRVCNFPQIDLSQPTIALQFEQGDEGLQDVIYCSKTDTGLLGNTDKRRWHGECYGNNNDANFLQTMDADGVPTMVGFIRIGEEACQIAPNALGQLEIECTTDGLFEEEEGLEDDELDDDDDEARRLLESQAVFAMSQSMNNNLRRGGRRLYADDGKHLDMMGEYVCSFAKC